MCSSWLATHGRSPLPFEKEREQVSGDYRKEAEAHLERADETYLRDKADILVAPELR